MGYQVVSQLQHGLSYHPVKLKTTVEIGGGAPDSFYLEVNSLHGFDFWSLLRRMLFKINCFSHWSVPHFYFVALSSEVGDSVDIFCQIFMSACCIVAAMGNGSHRYQAEDSVEL